MSDFSNIIAEIKKEIGLSENLNIVFKKTEDKNVLKVSRKGDVFTVCYSSVSDISRAVLIIKANIETQEFEIEEKSDFKDVCLMVDCSRNAVKTVETVKKLIRNIAMMGYTSLMLYTEDTYEVENEPFFGYLRGGYTKEEMTSLARYADDFGIELIPCIQTLAHLNQLKRYQYKHFCCFDCEDTLLVRDDRTYEVIENCFKTISECFTSKRIHIGMDEAGMLGRGRFLDENGYVPAFDIMTEHLNRVCEIAEKHHLTPIIWSDTFLKIAYKDKNSVDENGNVVIPERVLSKVPEKLILCNWEYHSLTPEGYGKKLSVHRQFKNPIWFAGGTAMDNRGFIPQISYSMKVSSAAISAAKKYGVESLVETVWGDNGGECPLFSSLPSIMHYSYTARKISSERLYKEFEALTGYKFDEFIKIEHSQTFCGKFTEDIANPAKYGLYNDVFLGYVDGVIKAEDKKYFKSASENIRNLEKGNYGYLFKTARSLCDVLALKYDMGIRLRTAYKNKDKKELKKCCKDINKTVCLLDKFTENYRNQWLTENKPHGLEIQEIRLGGLKERLKGCGKRLLDYLKGKVKSLPELEEKIIPQAISRIKNEGRCDLVSHEIISSVNSFDGFTKLDV